ncbi:Chromate resistance protein ChrB [Bacillus alkalicellulosilyticus]|uniref:Chromate resistance protein ChrB n=1 Tax=Alkalihalobacterium alkalicellulosilyticum TaxID=1912214 RepID=UPI0009973E79|nr:Chromate resistance protein ChrB [Bacillus alkalicellulosilyticus]
MSNWLHLTYKMPRKPSSPRVKIWRKLKSLGSIQLHDAIWLLPNTPYTYEQFQWLTVEIKELGGEATMWQSQLLFGMSHEDLQHLFIELVNESYMELLKQVDEGSNDLVSLAKKYQRIRKTDYFKSPLEVAVREKLIEKRSGQT